MFFPFSSITRDNATKKETFNADILFLSSNHHDHCYLQSAIRPFAETGEILCILSESYYSKLSEIIRIQTTSVPYIAPKTIIECKNSSERRQRKPPCTFLRNTDK